METKIKSLLNSPQEENQRIGCILAKDVLKWSNLDIGFFIINNPKGFDLIKRSFYKEYVKHFLGGRIVFRDMRSNNCELFIFDDTNSKSFSVPLPTKDCYVDRCIDATKEYLNLFIANNL